MPAIMIHQGQLIEFMLIFFRVLAMIIMIPFIGSSSVPIWVKAGFSFFMALIIYPLISNGYHGIFSDMNLPALILSILSQVLVGIIFGFLVLLVFSSVEIAGQLISVQIGFGMITLLNPMISNQQVSLISNLQNYIALLIFIETSAFYFVINGIYRSFNTIPLTFNDFQPVIFQYLVSRGAELFTIALNISMPIILTTILLNIIIALMGRLAPQFNIFAVGFPITIAVGLLMLYISVPYFMDYITHSFLNLNTQFNRLLNSIAVY